MHTLMSTLLTNSLLSVCLCSLGLPPAGWIRPCFLCSKALHSRLPLGWFGFLLSPSLCYSSRGNSWQLYFRCGIVELIFSPDKMAVLPSERFLLCLLFFILEPGCLPSHPFGISLSALLSLFHVFPSGRDTDHVSFGTLGGSLPINTGLHHKSISFHFSFN